MLSHCWCRRSIFGWTQFWTESPHNPCCCCCSSVFIPSRSHCWWCGRDASQTPTETDSNLWGGQSYKWRRQQSLGLEQVPETHSQPAGSCCGNCTDNVCWTAIISIISQPPPLPPPTCPAHWPDFLHTHDTRQSVITYSQVISGIISFEMLYSTSLLKNYNIRKFAAIFNYIELKNKTLKTLNRNFPKHLPLITQIIKFRRYLLDPFYSFCNHFRTKNSWSFVFRNTLNDF